MELKILHVLTSNGENGSYGGPVRVARELGRAANSENSVEMHILAGSLNGKLLQTETETHVPVYKLFLLSSVSDYFSIKFMRELYRKICNSDLVHLHFARDILQIAAGIICMIQKKPYITQTHGMIRKKNFLVYLFDLIFTKPILRSAKTNFLLTIEEGKSLGKVEKKLKPVFVPNGINLDCRNILEVQKFSKRRVIFCSRLHHTKGVKQFLEISNKFKDDESIEFLIYGADGGQLPYINKFIYNQRLKGVNNIDYFGALESFEVSMKILESDLLLLPSTYDPFPMIVLESLSLGTPVIISSTCGNASLVKKINPNMVCDSESTDEYVEKIRKIISLKSEVGEIDKLIEKAQVMFDIRSIWPLVLKEYY